MVKATRQVLLCRVDESVTTGSRWVCGLQDYWPRARSNGTWSAAGTRCCGSKRDKQFAAPKHPGVKLLFDDDLVEGVVQLCATGKRAGIPRCKSGGSTPNASAVIKCSTRTNGHGVCRVQMSWFHEWGLEQLLASTAARFAVLDGALAALAFRQARGRNDEGAELYADAGGQRRGIVALRPERFADDRALTRFLYHELGHLADMVDERFGYSPDLSAASQTASQLRLVRDRYRSCGP